MHPFGLKLHPQRPREVLLRSLGHGQRNNICLRRLRQMRARHNKRRLRRWILLCQGNELRHGPFGNIVERNGGDLEVADEFVVCDLEVA
ncbi:hypothetical protein TgHK011_002198 [Trichoderma gracile]|nr:hypothetical protein TgHK011_002198 [Trichoderma gracile]